jgi:pantetheine-phosphate adenylyltransferase
LAQRKAIYPGTFDPPTWGHLDLVHRGIQLVDELMVAVLANPEKTTLFTVEERVEMLEACVGEIPGVTIGQFEGLLVDYAKQCGCHSILRGLRAISDFEYEFQMALMNRRLDPELETVFLMPNEEHIFVSSRTSREIAQFGGNLESLVPDPIRVRLERKFPRK